MKYVYLGLSWVLGIATLLWGLGTMSVSALAGVTIMAASTLILPPARNFAYSKTGKSLSPKVRVAGIVGLLIVGGILAATSDEMKAQRLAQQEAALREQRAAELAQKRAQEFKANRDQILSEVKGFLESGNFQRAYSLSLKYQAAEDTDLSALNAKAKAKLDQKNAEEQAKQRIAEERKKSIESQFSPWDGSHLGLERVIKRAMNDPDSYDHVETVYWDRGDHLIVLTTFRGKNAFGGVVKNTVKAKVGLDGQVLQIMDQN